METVDAAVAAELETARPRLPSALDPHGDFRQELDFNGVYRVTATGKLELMTKDVAYPNALALSPDEKKLYAAKIRPDKFWMVYQAGNLYAAGTGGVLNISPQGKHLGTIQLPEVPANCAWGDNGRTLYLRARTGLSRIRLKARGVLS